MAMKRKTTFAWRQNRCRPPLVRRSVRGNNWPNASTPWVRCTFQPLLLRSSSACFWRCCCRRGRRNFSCMTSFCPRRIPWWCRTDFCTLFPQTVGLPSPASGAQYYRPNSRNQICAVDRPPRPPQRPPRRPTRPRRCRHPACRPPRLQPWWVAPPSRISHSPPWPVQTSRTGSCCRCARTPRACRWTRITASRSVRNSHRTIWTARRTSRSTSAITSEKRY